MSTSLYRYKCHVADVYDGDTVTLAVNCGFGIVLPKEKIRLYGIDAKEMRGEQKIDGKIARDALREKILHKDIILESIKDKKGKYGRWLGKIFLQDGDELLDINKWMIENEYAQEKYY